jgi:hypothetical protein
MWVWGAGKGRKSLLTFDIDCFSVHVRVGARMGSRGGGGMGGVDALSVIRRECAPALVGWEN